MRIQVCTSHEDEVISYNYLESRDKSKMGKLSLCLVSDETATVLTSPLFANASDFQIALVGLKHTSCAIIS